MTNNDAIRILTEQKNKFLDEWIDYGGVAEAYNMAINALKNTKIKGTEDRKLIDIDKLREKLGFSENCENCKQDYWTCERETYYSIKDFCQKLDTVIEELIKEE